MKKEKKDQIIRRISEQSMLKLTPMPLGPNKGKHKLFEGGEKRLYICKYCGTDNTGLAILTSMSCYRHPSGPNKGKHAPAL
jgi:hypothetical protein